MTEVLMYSWHHLRLFIRQFRDPRRWMPTWLGKVGSILHAGLPNVFKKRRKWQPSQEIA
jgi:hypothetical protein